MKTKAAALNILMVSAEAAPYATTGGLGEVAPSLARAMAARGHNVRLFIPGYSSIDRSWVGKGGSSDFAVELAGELHQASLRQFDAGGVTVGLLENEEFFGRPGLYGEGGIDYSDNDRRFAFFCRGVLVACRHLGFRPDIIHCHDWQAALVPYLLRHSFSADSFFSGTATLFTIHNLAFQGIFPPSSLAAMGLGWDDFTISRLEYYGNINLLKGALISTDRITTVSPRYGEEILSADMGCGLEGVLAERRADLSGILNGIDVDEWNPASDRFIAGVYTAEDISGKEKEKRRLQEEFELVPGASPLVGMVTRLTEQKGVDLLLEVLPWLLQQDVQLLVLGTGEQRYVDKLLALGKTAPGKLALVSRFDPAVSHRIFAGSDLFLMPSRFEPCGIGQLIALRYGTVPVVRRTGGLADTVVGRQDDASAYTGFVFDGYEPEALVQALEEALSVYGMSEEWKAVRQRGMAVDFSWQRSAGEYESLYGDALAVRRRG